MKFPLTSLLQHPKIILSLAIGLAYQPALAHNININLTPEYSTGSNPENGGIAAYNYSYGVDSQTTIPYTIANDPCAKGGHTGCYTDNGGRGSGWYNGTQTQLGNSHSITANVMDSVFYVANPLGAQVTLNVSSYYKGQPSKAENPALSVYSGLMYGMSHDDVISDPLIPISNDAFGNFVTAVSPKDAAPNDPGIRSQYFDANGNSVANADWNRTFAQIKAEGGQDPDYVASGANETYNTNNLAYLEANHPDMTPAEWYALNYTDHNGYRDTLNYVNLGGLADAADPNQSFNGQFDAFGNWSMGDSNDPALNNDQNHAAVATLHYIASVSNTDCSGPNCTPTFVNVPGVGLVQTGGHLNTHQSSPTSETLTLYLAQGWYSVWAGGNAGPANSAMFDQTVTLDINPVSAVPLPGTFYLFGSVLLGFAKLGYRKRR